MNSHSTATSGAVIILSVVTIGNAINFWQTYRSQRAIERLREAVTSTASVFRDGDWKEISRHGVVPADIVRLFSGSIFDFLTLFALLRYLHARQAEFHTG